MSKVPRSPLPDPSAPKRESCCLPRGRGRKSKASESETQVRNSCPPLKFHLVRPLRRPGFSGVWGGGMTPWCRAVDPVGGSVR